MSESEVTRKGLRGIRPGREAIPGKTGDDARRWRRKGRAEQPMVPEPEFTSYYGKPVLNPPVWEARGHRRGTLLPRRAGFQAALSLLAA